MIAPQLTEVKYMAMSGSGKFYRNGISLLQRLPNCLGALESFCALMKRGYQGIYYKMSVERLHRCITEFEVRHNDRSSDTIDQMTGLVQGMMGRRLRYIDLVNPVHLDGQAALV